MATVQRIALAMKTKRRLPATKRPAEGIPAVQIFRTNVRALLAAAKHGERPVTQETIAAGAKIPLRTFTHHLSLNAEGSSAPTLRTLQAVADAFGMKPWMLLVEGLPYEIVLSPQVQRTVDSTMSRYFGALPESRSALDEPAKFLPQRNKPV